MLVVDPYLRISVEEALATPFVMWKNEPGEVETDTPPLGRDTGHIDNMGLSEKEWKSESSTIS